jgi:divalent metal cation (Fe/Co/Zn/Cd) transporter
VFICRCDRPSVRGNGLALHLDLGQGFSDLEQVTCRQFRSDRSNVFLHTATSDSPIRAVFAEDLTALIALVAAALGMLLHELTGKAVFDAAGSIAIGILMAVTALFLISRNARFLSGASLAPEQWSQVLAAIRAAPPVARVTFLYTEFIGPGRCLVIAGVGISGDHSQPELAAILRDIERSLMRRPHIGLAIMTLATADDRNLEP